MTLTAEQISKVFKKMVREYVKTQPCNMTKDDFKSAVTDTDQWVINNESSFNIALPEPFKSNATQTEKALLLAYVLSVKYLGG